MFKNYGSLFLMFNQVTLKSLSCSLCVLYMEFVFAVDWPQTCGGYETSGCSSKHSEAVLPLTKLFYLIFSCISEQLTSHYFVGYEVIYNSWYNDWLYMVKKTLWALFVAFPWIIKLCMPNNDNYIYFQVILVILEPM